MGAFFLSRRQTRNDTAAAVARDILRQQGLAHITDLSGEKFSLFYCRKVNVDSDSLYQRDNNNFCLSTGTLIYKKSIAAEAAQKLFEDFSSNQLDTTRLYGNFAILICINGNIRIYNDQQGVYEVFHDADKQVFSSSFLAVASMMNKLSVNSHAVYEYVFQEAVFGGETVFREIKRLKVKTAFELDGPARQIPALTNEQTVEHSNDLEFHLQRNHENLKQQFAAITRCFGGNIDSALSGGYDSRLLLGLCREHDITPHLHVYGKAESPDVVVAKHICEQENIRLKHQDKSSCETVEPGQFADIVQNNLFHFKGYCADGILDNGSDLTTRMQRTEGGRLLLNGGGGEVFRNFFYLPDKSYKPRELCWSFYSRFDPTTCTDRFNEENYYQHLEKKLAESAGSNKRKLNRRQVEYLYAGFRCTYWMGQNNAINNQFGWFLTPYVDENISLAANDIPIGLKNHGYFQGQLINKVSPALASYPSDYGYRLNEAVTLKRRIRDYSTILRPPLLRKYTYRLKKTSRDNWPYFLADDYIKAILPDGFEIMSAFFKMDLLTDMEQFKRICTLEYLFRYLNTKF